MNKEDFRRKKRKPCFVSVIFFLKWTVPLRGGYEEGEDAASEASSLVLILASGGGLCVFHPASDQFFHRCSAELPLCVPLCAPSSESLVESPLGMR